MAVTKHSKHLEILEDLLHKAKEYVENFNRNFEEIVKTMLAEQKSAFDGMDEDDYDDLMDDHRPGGIVIAPEPELEKASGNRHMSTVGPGPMLSYVKKQLQNPHRQFAADVLEQTKILLSKDPFAGSEQDLSKLSIEEKLNILSNFGVHDTLRQLPTLFFGIESLEKKGSLHWFDRIETLISQCDLTRERYQTSLDEKRNFWAFMLGIVSIATFPFAVMTGYFGMNFENMAG